MEGIKFSVFEIKRDHPIPARKSNLVLINKKRTCYLVDYLVDYRVDYLVDFAVPADSRMKIQIKIKKVKR